MKTQLRFVLIPMLVFGLSACGDKKGSGSRNDPPPASPAGPKNKKSVPAETGSDEISEGEGELPRSSRRSTLRKSGSRTGVKPTQEIDGDYSSLDSDDDVDGSSLRSTEVARAEPGQSWVMPPLQGTPAIAWLTRNVDPVLNAIQFSGPPALMMGRQVRLTLALGYFDGFHSEGLSYNGVDYGKHAAVDPFLRSAVHAVLTRPCQGQNQLCGFQEGGGDDVEKRYVRAGQEVRLLSGALTPFYQENVRRRSQEQSSRSVRAEQAFLNSFNDSDMVIYVGHSREGGGPDFRPARLSSSGQVDYPFYKARKEGLRRVIEAISGGQRKAGSFAIVSCDSSDHFLRDLRRAGPNLELITTRGKNIRAEKLLAAGLLSAELFLRQGRAADVSEIAAERVDVLPSLRVLPPSSLAQR